MASSRFTLPQKKIAKGAKRTVVAVSLPKELNEQIKKLGKDQGGYSITEVIQRMIVHCLEDLEEKQKGFEEAVGKRKPVKVGRPKAIKG